MNMKHALLLLWRIILTVACFYAFAVLALWFFYSMDTMVSGGSYTATQAKSLTLQMALVTTRIASAGVLCSRMLVGRASVRKQALTSSLAVGLVLLLYTLFNVMWRNTWEPGSRRAAFLPPWSELNSRFFYEYNWLSYLIFLIPAAMLFSACISFWFWRDFKVSEQKL
jgi:hypothetical protein